MINIWREHSYSIILLLLIFVLSLIIMPVLHNASSDEFIRVTIDDGDSLWLLSEKYEKVHKLSTTEFIRWVKKHNGIAGDQIYTGDVIVIPVTRELDNTQELVSSDFK